MHIRVVFSGLKTTAKFVSTTWVRWGPGGRNGGDEVELVRGT